MGAVYGYDVDPVNEGASDVNWSGEERWPSTENVSARDWSSRTAGELGRRGEPS